MFTRHSDNQSQCCIDNDTVVTCFYMNNKTVKMMIFTLIQTGSSSLFNIFIRFSYTCSANRMPVQGGRGASGLSKHITGKSTAKNKRKRKVTWSHSALWKQWFWGCWQLHHKHKVRSQSVKRWTGVKTTCIQ